MGTIVQTQVMTTSHQKLSGESNAKVVDGDLDFSEPALADARDRVKEKDTDVNWMGITYEKGSNKLKLIGCDTGALEDVLDELNDGKVQYFLLHHSKDFKDGKSPKLILICWVGAGVPSTIKGAVHTHADQV